MKQLVRTYRDIEIFVDEDGLFSAKKGTTEFTGRSLNDVIKKITLTLEPIDVLVFDGYSGIRSPRRVQVIPDPRQNRFRNVEDGRLLDAYSFFYIYDEKIEAQFSDIVERYNELYKEFGKLSDSLKPIHARDLARRQDTGG